MARRTVDPYRDLDVIDARAPRTNQAVVALVSVVALATGWWGLVALLALQLVVGLRFGRRFCLPCVLYFQVLEPIFGEGEIEDSRPPRFANVLGALVLTAGAVVVEVVPLLPLLLLLLCVVRVSSPCARAVVAGAHKKAASSSRGSANRLSFACNFI